MEQDSVRNEKVPLFCQLGEPPGKTLLIGQQVDHFSHCSVFTAEYWPEIVPSPA